MPERQYSKSNIFLIFVSAWQRLKINSSWPFGVVKTELFESLVWQLKGE